MGGAILIAWSRMRDNDLLREAALRETTNCQNDAERILVLNEWVYHNQGFAKNRGYFLFPALGPTPVHVLQMGGDCADKSRLLSALLAQINIPATLAMLYPCATCTPSHTIVEAKYEKGWLAVDPVYNYSFPDHRGGYYGITDLGKNHQLLIDRVQALRIQRGEADPTSSYNIDNNNYMYAKTINWDKNALTRAVGSLVSIFSADSYLVRRPHFLEEPKLLLILMCLGIAIFSVFLYASLWYWNKSRRSSSQVGT